MVFWTSLPPEAENFCTFRTYFIVFTTKNDAFLKGFANKNPKKFPPPASKQQSPPLIPNPSLIRGGLSYLGGLSYMEFP